MPPAALDSLTVGGDQHRRIKNSVLLGTNQLFAFKKQHTTVTEVFDEQIRHRTTLTGFLNQQRFISQCGIGQSVFERSRRRG